MKIIAMSDLHGHLPNIRKRCDVVCICGDIVPLEHQSSHIRSLMWFATDFIPWCYKLKCEKVLFIGGNHDFFLDWSCFAADVNSEYREYISANYLNKNLLYDDTLNKILYLQDTSYEYQGIKFYGTPWIPDLKRWMFYQDSENLKRLFDKIPDDVDVLLTHSPGKFVCDTGVSLECYNKPEYGSAELTESVVKKKPRYWLCGHVHSGNHKMSQFEDTQVVNVSLKNEHYEAVYDPFCFEIEPLKKETEDNG